MKKTQNKKIKILRIIARLNIGGPAIHTTLLTKELNNDGFQSILLCGRHSKDEGDMGYMAERYNITPIYIPRLEREINPFHDIAAFFRIFMFILKYRPDIVHTHTAKAGTLGRLAAIFAGVPVKAHTFHGNIFHGYFDEKKTRFFIFIEKLLAVFTDAVIAISQNGRDDVVNRYKIANNKKCRVIKLGFDLEKFVNADYEKGAFRKRFNFKDDDILVGIVGRLAPIKNHKMFIQTVEYIAKYGKKDMVDKIRFVIIGDGELKSELLAYTRFKRLEKKILFTGWVKDIGEAYRGLDIVALTSINEGTPVSLIEAMASLKPVVSTDVGGVRDTVGDAGILVKSGDYEGMGDKILELAGSAEKRSELGARGRNLVMDVYSKERLVSELSGLYLELVRGHSASRSVFLIRKFLRRNTSPCRVSPPNKE